MSKAVTTGLTRSAPRDPRAQPLPADVEHGELGWGLDRGGHRADEHPDDRATALRVGEAAQHDAEHQRVVVRARHEGEQDQRVEDRQDEDRRRVPTVLAGQLGDAPGDEHHADEGEQPQKDDRAEHVVHAQAGQRTVDDQEERTVGCRGVPPEGVDPAHVRAAAEDVGPVDVGADVVAHHLALGRVRVNVLAEQGWYDQHGQHPQPEDDGQVLDGHPRTHRQRLGQPIPDPHKQHQTAVDGHQADEESLVGRSWRRGHAEEPGPGHLELEGRAREGRAEGHHHQGDEAEDGRSAQEGGVVHVGHVALPLAEPAPRQQAQAQQLQAHGGMSRPVIEPVRRGGPQGAQTEPRGRTRRSRSSAPHLGRRHGTRLHVAGEAPWLGVRVATNLRSPYHQVRTPSVDGPGIRAPDSLRKRPVTVL